MFLYVGLVGEPDYTSRGPRYKCIGRTLDECLERLIERPDYREDWKRGGGEIRDWYYVDIYDLETGERKVVT